jgi:hypothetical protein
VGKTFGIKLKEKKFEIPGPGDYKTYHKDFPTKGHASIGNAKKTDLWISKSTKNLPGPACYDTKNGFVVKKVTIQLPLA